MPPLECGVLATAYESVGEAAHVKKQRLSVCVSCLVTRSVCLPAPPLRLTAAELPSAKTTAVAGQREAVGSAVGCGCVPYLLEPGHVVLCEQDHAVRSSHHPCSACHGRLLWRADAELDTAAAGAVAWRPLSPPLVLAQSVVGLLGQPVYPPLLPQSGFAA